MRINRLLIAASILGLGTFMTVVSLRADESGPDLFRIRPKGHGTVIREKPHNGPTGGAVVTGNGINYNGGPVMTSSPINLYYILYGNWSGQDPTGPAILDAWAQNIAPSPYFNINTTYGDSTGNVPNAVTFRGTYVDTGTLGTSLNDGSIGTLTSNAINHGFAGAPVPAGTADPNGLYMVLTAPGVGETSGFISNYCGWHWSGSFVSGAVQEGYLYSGYPVVKFAFIGNAAGPSLGNCAEQTSSSPNNDPGADAMISVMAHELSETVSDPEGNAWYASNGEENGDLCAWNFGSTYTSNGALANVNLNGTNYLMQRIWLNAGGGSCALSYAASADFTVGISGSPQTIAHGTTSGNYTLTDTPSNGFNGTVTWTFSNVPSGIAVNSLNGLSGSPATFTLSAASNLAAGAYSVTVTGTSGSLVHSTTASLTVTAPDFNVSVSGSQTVAPGGTTNNYTLSASPLNGFNGAVSWAFGALPSGITASPNPPVGGNSSTFKLTAASTVTAGSYSIQITGTSGSLHHAVNASLVVGTPTFSLSITPTSQTVTRPSSGTKTATYTVHVTAVGAFTHPVTLSVTGGTTGVTPHIVGTNPVNPGSSGIMMVVVSNSALRGHTRTLTVTGTASGTASKQATATITIQ
jgi:hypothetical protein